MERKPAAVPKKPAVPVAPPKVGFALFTEKFFQLRRAAFQTGCVAVLAHILLSLMAVVGLYQILIASLHFSECPANEFLPQFLIMMGCIALLDMVFAVLVIIPMEITTVFFYTLLMIRVIIVALIVYGFSMLKGIRDREMTHFCVEILTSTLELTLWIMSSLIVAYVIILFFNVITAIALMRRK